MASRNSQVLLIEYTSKSERNTDDMMTFSHVQTLEIPSIKPDTNFIKLFNKPHATDMAIEDAIPIEEKQDKCLVWAVFESKTQWLQAKASFHIKWISFPNSSG